MQNKESRVMTSPAENTDRIWGSDYVGDSSQDARRALIQRVRSKASSCKAREDAAPQYRRQSRQSLGYRSTTIVNGVNGKRP